MCVRCASARVKAFGIDFLPMAFNQSTTCERRNIRQTANVIKFTNRVHMFWLIEECTTIMYICIALHSEHSKLYLRHQRWSSFRFFYAIINLFRITISAPKTQFKRFLYVFFHTNACLANMFSQCLYYLCSLFYLKWHNFSSFIQCRDKKERRKKAHTIIFIVWNVRIPYAIPWLALGMVVCALLFWLFLI